MLQLGVGIYIMMIGLTILPFKIEPCHKANVLSFFLLPGSLEKSQKNLPSSGLKSFTMNTKPQLTALYHRNEDAYYVVGTMGWWNLEDQHSCSNFTQAHIALGAGPTRAGLG